MLGLGPPELIIIAIVILALFGYKKLPDAARAVGRSARILKAETKGLREDPAPRDLEAKAEAEYRRETTPPPAAAPRRRRRPPRLRRRARCTSRRRPRPAEVGRAVTVPNALRRVVRRRSRPDDGPAARCRCATTSPNCAAG